MTSMSKRFFYSLFKTTWEKSFTEKNIQYAFAKPGIWPINSDAVVSKLIQSKQTEEKDLEVPFNPQNGMDIHRMKRGFDKASLEEKLQKVDELLDALEKKTAKLSIAQKEASDLRATIILEQKKRQRGKRLNLASEEIEGTEIYSPLKVVKAVEYHNELNRLAAEKEAVKQERKAVREANKVRKEKEKEEKEARQAATQLQKDLKAASAFILGKTSAPSAKSKSITKLSKEPVLEALEVSTPPASPQKKQDKTPKNLIVTLKVSAPDLEVVQLERGGRPIRLLQRFRNTK
ncbi:hypothetical protein BDZ45DRAFT_770300 [Acephala macrosclerotiorum]|nr:hypothetical protein BDZ45DRAFT_770300 [Acephala macrosclerotiorum]